MMDCEASVSVRKHWRLFESCFYGICWITQFFVSGIFDRIVLKHVKTSQPSKFIASNGSQMGTLSDACEGDTLPL